MEAYSDDLRERVLEAYDRGAGSLRYLAELFGVSHAWIGKLLKLRRKRGSLTLADLRSRPRLKCSLSLICRELKRAGFTFKEQTFRASEQLCDDVQEERKGWRRWLSRFDPCRLVFLDESDDRVGMKRLYGRSAAGWRIVDEEPGGHWRTHTVTAAIRRTGVVMAMVTKRAINSVTFLGFVERFSAPELRPGDIVVTDNLAVHKVAGIEEALSAAGAEALAAVLVRLQPNRASLVPGQELAEEGVADHLPPARSRRRSRPGEDRPLRVLQQLHQLRLPGHIKRQSASSDSAAIA